MRLLLWSLILIGTLGASLGGSLSAEQPWGRDADLTKCMQGQGQGPCSPACPASLLARFGEKAIRFHQEVISPADGPRSHFIPSSSQYTLDAMRKYGFFQGYILGCDRLMRENEEEWVYRKVWDPSHRYMIKWNPVPNS